MAPFARLGGIAKSKRAWWAAITILVLAGGSYVLDVVTIVKSEIRVRQTSHFFDSVLEVTSKTDVIAQIPLSALPGSPAAVCSIAGYGDEDDIAKFLGEKLFGKSSLGSGKTSNILFAYDSFTATMESPRDRPRFSVKKTSCLRGTVLVIVRGRDIDFQAIGAR